MPSNRIKNELCEHIYFVTLTVKNWYYIFDRHNRWNILADSLNFCIKKKGLSIFAYVFMMNHIHFVAQSEKLSAVLRDFKSFTARSILDNCKATEPSVLKLFQVSSNNYELWEHTNMPIILENENVLHQKINYIHNNPVRKNYVRETQDWLWSSARFYENGKQEIIEITEL